jgi:hypothetical protein
MKLDSKKTNLIAAILLIFVFLICVFSVKDDSLTMDELAHLPAGYSYLTQKDMRLNPEHPPLIKDLAAIPLLFIRGIKFPSQIDAWKKDVNGQWGFGNYFLFKTGNPADKMIFLGRIPMILVLILLGFFIFKWVKEIYGNFAAILALFLFSFSPTFLAHGRLVTTDVGAAAGYFIATYYFLKALKKPSKKNIIFAGISFGLAQLAKFTVIILIPYFIFLAFAWWIFKSKKFLQTLKVLISVFVIGYILIWPVYLYHVWNYPLEKQIFDIEELLKEREIPILGKMIKRLPKLTEVLIWLAKNPVLRPYSHYLTGLSLVIFRGMGGHTMYFLGEVSAAGWRNFFPFSYVVKEPLAFHILTIIALIWASLKIKEPFWKRPLKRIFDWIREHFVEFSSLTLILIYWAFSLSTPLTLGIRHLLPIFPFTFLLVSGAMNSILKPPYLKLKYSVLAILILWQAISVIKIYPHFLSYANEIVGPENLYIYTVDSNLDWGQDLKRLKKWVDENKIEKIYIDYFGGADVEYYFGKKYLRWWGTRDPNEFEKPNYFAISASFLQGGKGLPAKGFDQPTGYYLWLEKYKPIARIGYSIFVYYID